MKTEYFVPIVDAKNVPKLDESAKQTLCSDANREWLSFKQMTQDLRDDALEAAQLYYANRPAEQDYSDPEAADGSSSNIRRPVLSQAIDSLASQQHLATFPMNERFFRADACDENSARSREIYERHLANRLSHVNFIMNAKKDRKSLMLAGASAVWCPFVRKTRDEVTYEPKKVMGISLPGSLDKKKKPKTVFEGTAFIPIDFEDWVVDPTVDDFQESPFQWRRWVSKYAIKSIKAFENTDNITSYRDFWKEFDVNSNKETIYNEMGIQRSFDYTDAQSEALAGEMTLLYERWGDFVVDDELYENHVLIYSNDSTFHYFGQNPYDHQLKPFVGGPYIPLSGTVYGKSMKDVIPLCHALDTLLNQFIDIHSFAANPFYTYLISDDVFMEWFAGGKQRLAPGEGIPVNSHESLMLRQWPLGNLDHIQNMMQVIKEEIRESTGGVPYTTGGSSASDQQRTLGEIEILAQGTSVRIQDLIETYEETKLKNWLTMAFENDRQFMTESVTIGDSNEVLLPTEVKRLKMEFSITGSKTVLNKQREMQQYDQFIMTLPQLLQSGFVHPNGDTMELNIPEVLKSRMMLGDMKNLDNIIKIITPEEAPNAPMLGSPENGQPGIPPGNGPLPPDIAPGGLQAPEAGGAPPPVGGPQMPPGMGAIA